MKNFLVGYQRFSTAVIVAEDYFVRQQERIPAPLEFQYQIAKKQGEWKIEPLTVEQQIALIKYDPKAFKYIDNPHEDVLLYVKLENLI